MTVQSPFPWMPAKSHGGEFPPDAPFLLVVHCTESGNDANTAESLAGPNWFGGPAGTSAHAMVDRNSGVDMVRDNRVAYHAGRAGNTSGLSLEFCGRAGWSKSKWREPAQMTMLRLGARRIAVWAFNRDVPVRWLSLAQVKKAANSRRPQDGGLCTHNDVRLALGGTTHTDPGPNFPYDELLQMVKEEVAVLRGDDTPHLTPAQEGPLMALTDKQQSNLYIAQGRIDEGVHDLIEAVTALAGRVETGLVATARIDTNAVATRANVSAAAREDAARIKALPAELRREWARAMKPVIEAALADEDAK